jgi:hypothetical protein
LEFLVRKVLLPHFGDAMTFVRRLTAACLFGSLAFAPAALAADEKKEAAAADAEAPEEKAARELVTKYLTAVKAKKWKDALKLVHPKTVAAIAERKKRMGKEDHPMAPATFEKTDYYLKEFKIASVKPTAVGTFTVEATEDNYQVVEKGISEGDQASYLVGKSEGKWYVVDKKRNETFTSDSIKYGYKGYFDKVEKPAAVKEEE